MKKSVISVLKINSRYLQSPGLKCSLNPYFLQISHSSLAPAYTLYSHVHGGGGGGGGGGGCKCRLLQEVGGTQKGFIWEGTTPRTQSMSS